MIETKSGLPQINTKLRFALAHGRQMAAALVFVSALLVYLLTLAPTVTLVDSGELVVDARNMGIGHPPGFPFYLLLTHWFTLLPISNVAARVNFASAFFAASAAGLLTLALAQIEAPLLRGSELGEPWRARGRGSSEREEFHTQTAAGEHWRLFTLLAPALMAGGVFAFSRTLWSYATVAEVYSLNSLLLVSALFCILRWRSTVRDNATENRWVYLAALALGLGLAVHHVTVALALPAFLWLLYSIGGLEFFWSRRFLYALLSAAAGVCVYVYLPIAASRHPVLNWGDPRTLERIWNHVTAVQYRGGIELSISRIFALAKEFLMYASREFGPRWLPLVFVLAALGFGTLARRDRALFYFVLVFISGNLAFNFLYQISEDKDAYYLPIYIAVVILAAVGVRWLTLKAASMSLGIAGSYAVMAALVLASIGVAFVGNFSHSNRRRDLVAREYVDNILQTVSPGGMLLTTDWQVFSPMLYAREVEGTRRDVILLDLELLRRSWYLDDLQQQYPDLFRDMQKPILTYRQELEHWESDPKAYELDLNLSRQISTAFSQLVISLVADHSRAKSVYVTQDVLSMARAGKESWAQSMVNMGLVPQGLVFALAGNREFDDPANAPLRLRALQERSRQVDDDDVVKTKVLPAYLSMILNRGRYLQMKGHPQEALAAYKEALAIDPASEAAQKLVSKALEGMGTRGEASH
ncbi:MAG TPA: DUF2723 domain-containing protein [Terriglobales bacterium]|nr:DUF2723 domain-containing protein [Terriglobales bacterium]